MLVIKVININIYFLIIFLEFIFVWDFYIIFVVVYDESSLYYVIFSIFFFSFILNSVIWKC